MDWFASCCSFVVHQVFEKPEWERGRHETSKHTHGKEDDDKEERARAKKKGKIRTCGIITQWFITGCKLRPGVYHDEVNGWHSIAFMAPLNVVIWIIWAHSWVIIFLAESSSWHFFLLFPSSTCRLRSLIGVPLKCESKVRIHLEHLQNISWRRFPTTVFNNFISVN